MKYLLFLRVGKKISCSGEEKGNLKKKIRLNKADTPAETEVEPEPESSLLVYLLASLNAKLMHIPPPLPPSPHPHLAYLYPVGREAE